MIRLAILISGRGSNMLCLADAIENYKIEASVALVISNKDCDGIALAAARGLATKVVKRSDFDNRLAHDAAIASAIEDCHADYVFMAGYMAILGTVFVDQFAGKLINIHPSLLPAFKGLDTHQRAIDAGVKTHGVSIHLVNAALDDGPLILQASLAVAETDTAKILAGRVLQLEHQIYPFVLLSLAAQNVTLLSDEVIWHAKMLTSAPVDMQNILAHCVIWPECDLA
ncbi:phosphoribosylglycinamide formyltransferase [Candidatus Puniceispirillum sp.]|nr:phosphoribosylglycinamide formyltransferase [Candidatus Puniceispirillum sp.]